MSLKDQPAATRPREKLLTQGASSLADAELLALLLRTGVQGQGVLQLADAVLTRFGGFAGLLHADPAALKGIKGLGPAKRAELSAVVEMVRRALSQRLVETPVLETGADVKKYLQLHLAHKTHEVFAVLFLDPRQRLLTMEEMFRGSVSQTTVYAREVVRRAMALNAAAVILAHNHPTGVAEPSRADVYMTESLTKALALVDVLVLDHFVVGHGHVTSLMEQGLL